MMSPAATYVALVTVSLTVGYWAGTRWVLQASSANSRSKTGGGGSKAVSESESGADSETSEGPPGEELASVKASLLEDCKLVLIVRTDLGMSPGKIAAQCSHATLACYKALGKSNPVLLRRWERTGQSKVALRANSEEELDTLEATARSLNLCARSIHDAGRTQIAAGSRTVLGVGPGPTRLVNQVTSKLRLL